MQQSPLSLQIKPLHPDFKSPKQATNGSAGFDVYMPEAGHIPAGEKVKVGLGFATAFPTGYAGIMLPRSGKGTEELLELANTVPLMDSDYRGEWMATLRTKDGRPFSWKAGDRIIQVAIVPIPKMEMLIVDELDATARGEAGHGSTGD